MRVLLSISAPDCEDITQLKNKLVWSYVELKAFDILSENNIEFWFFIHSNCSLRLFMFSVLIYDEFYDSGDSPALMDEFDTLAPAYAYYQSLCKGGKIDKMTTLSN